MKDSKNEIAIIGFICSICGYFSAGLTSIFGLVLSIIGLKKSKKLNGSNKTFAKVGIVLSIIQILLIVLFVFFLILLDGDFKMFNGNRKKDYRITEERKYIDEQNVVYIEGKLTNISNDKLKNINISYTTYDEEKNITGNCSTYVEEVPKKRTWKFTASCDAIEKNIVTFKLKEVIVNGFD